MCLGLIGLTLCGCTSTLSSLNNEQRQRDFAFQEMRREIGDLKHTLQGYRTELELLQERISDQENNAKLAQKARPQNESLAQIAACERKMMLLEKNLEKLASDLRNLNQHAQQTNLSLAGFKDKMFECQRELALHKQKLDGVTQLKTTLGQISQAIGDRSSPAASPVSSYKVKPGDTLEKIARKHNISLPALKRLNNIAQDKIIVGQELKITDNGD